jgi:FHA domain
VAHLVWTFNGDDRVLHLKKHQRIGRHPSADVQVLDKIVSKAHAELEKRGDRFVIRDLGSMNGTYVNGARLSGERVLEHQDEIGIGNVEFLFADLHQALERAGEPMTSSQVFRGQQRRNVPRAREHTVTSDGPRSPVSLRVPREVERSLVVHEKLERALRSALSVSGRDALIAKALDDVVDLLAADWGASFLAPLRAGIGPVSVAARGAPAPAEVRYEPTLAQSALENGRSVCEVQPVYGYRSWEPVCRIAVPLSRNAVRHALLWVERRGSDEGLPFEQVDLFAEIVGALL